MSTLSIMPLVVHWRQGITQPGAQNPSNSQSSLPVCSCPHSLSPFKLYTSNKPNFTYTSVSNSRLWSAYFWELSLWHQRYVCRFSALSQFTWSLFSILTIRHSRMSTGRTSMCTGIFGKRDILVASNENISIFSILKVTFWAARIPPSPRHSPKSVAMWLSPLHNNPLQCAHHLANASKGCNIIMCANTTIRLQLPSF